MCLAVPGKVIKITSDKKSAMIDILGNVCEASVALLDDLKEGDYVIVHAGCAISRIDEKEAAETLEILRQLKDINHGAD